VVEDVRRMRAHRLGSAASGQGVGLPGMRGDPRQRPERGPEYLGGPADRCSAWRWRKSRLGLGRGSLLSEKCEPSRLTPGTLGLQAGEDVSQSYNRNAGKDAAKLRV